MSDYPFPEVYATRRPLHDDWPWPLSLIPRRWTWVGLPMGPRKVLGNIAETWVREQVGYPLAPDAQRRYLHWWDGNATVLVPHILSIHPVHRAGFWSLQAHYIPFLRRRLPLYLTVSIPVRIPFVGRFRWHFNGGPLAPLAPLAVFLLPGFFKLTALLLLLGIKPDVTPGDWGHWVEFSHTFKRED